MQGQPEEKQTLQLEDFESKTGSVSELDPQDKARLELARLILGWMGTIFILSCLWLLYSPTDSAASAKEIFEFVKTIVPAIVTLVIGFYFRNES